VAFGVPVHWIDTLPVHLTSPARVLAAGALTVAVVDGLDAIVFWALRGVRPGRVFQGIAAGFYGRASFQGGGATVALGIAVHALVASSVVVAFYLAASRWRSLVRRPFLAGPLYGLVVYAFMNGVVIPLSAIGVPRFAWLQVANGLFIHVVAVGTPAVFFARAALSMADARRRMPSSLSSGRTQPNPSTSALAGSRRDQ
jgi:hypothetical protein